MSNFWPSAVSLDGVQYPSVENAYQAAKTYPEHRAPFEFCTPGAAKRAGKKVPMRPEWENEKVAVMRDLLAKKFRAGSLLAAKLLDTGDAHIEEGNSWGDRFWGVCGGSGSNTLGKLIMERRHSLVVARELAKPAAPR